MLPSKTVIKSPMIFLVCNTIKYYLRNLYYYIKIKGTFREQKGLHEVRTAILYDFYNNIIK